MDQRMKSTILPTRLYLAAAYLVGAAIVTANMSNLEIENPWMLTMLCLLASLALILKVEGPTNRSHYTFSFVVYGFTFATLGTSATMLVILVSHLVEWVWSTPPWHIQLFNAAVYLIAAETAGLIYRWIAQNSLPVSARDILAILVSMAAFTALSHLLTWLRFRLGHRGKMTKAEAFDLFPFILDVSLLYFGVSLSIVWKANPLALTLLVIPTYWLYTALKIPALQRKTEIDSKTGLFNHAYFKKQLDAELSRSRRFDRPVSVIIADLDLLRNINNTYGHLAGDAVLIGIAQAMKHSVREYDVVSRFGGEEFAILLPETTLVQAYEKAEFFRKMIEAMEFTIPTSVTPIRATMSFGVAQREKAGQTANEIVHNADLALYNSKLRGRNRTYAHTKNSYLDFPNDPPGGSINPAGVELNPPAACILETILLPPNESL
jgi:diguanylate cyclase (GGDEF)-like protein